MQRTTLEDWKFTHEIQNKPYLTNSIFEGNNPEFAFFFSQIEEWGLMKYCTKLQIYQNKLSPHKIYDSGNVWFLCDLFDETSFTYDWTLDGFVCFRQLINKGSSKYSYPFIIFNLSNLTYASIDGNSFQTLRKDSGHSFTAIGVEGDKDTLCVNFDFEELTWTKLSKFG